MGQRSVHPPHPRGQLASPALPPANSTAALLGKGAQRLCVGSSSVMGRGAVLPSDCPAEQRSAQLVQGAHRHRQLCCRSRGECWLCSAWPNTAATLLCMT